MVLTMLPGKGIYAAESGTSGEGENAFAWTLDDEGTLTISGSGKPQQEHKWDGENWGYVSPWDKDAVKKVIIEKGIQSIGAAAFDGCSSLTIRCYEGSAGEKYAKENEIPYELINVTETIDMVEVGISDEKLVVANGQDAVDAAIAKNEAQKKAVEALFGSSMTQEEKTKELIGWFEKTTGYKIDASKSLQILAVADVSLAGSAAMPAEGLDITLSVPGVKGGDNMYFLIHLKSDGTWENIAATAGDGTLTGHFTSLSPVYVVKAEDATKVPDSPATEIPDSPATSGQVTNYWFWFVLLAATFCAMAATAFVKRRDIFR